MRTERERHEQLRRRAPAPVCTFGPPGRQAERAFDVRAESGQSPRRVPHGFLVLHSKQISCAGKQGFNGLEASAKRGRDGDDLGNLSRPCDLQGAPFDNQPAHTVSDQNHLSRNRPPGSVLVDPGDMEYPIDEFRKGTGCEPIILAPVVSEDIGIGLIIHFIADFVNDVFIDERHRLVGPNKSRHLGVNRFVQRMQVYGVKILL